MNIMDVAVTVAPECRTKIIGVRPGEKLHEVMITADDSWNTVELADRYVIQPADSWWDRAAYLQLTGGAPVPEGFVYSSDRNPIWMKREELQALLEQEPVEL